VVAVDAEDPVGGQERDDLADRADVPEPRRGAQAYEGRLVHRLDEEHLGGVDRPPPVASQPEEEPLGRDGHAALSHERPLRCKGADIGDRRMAGVDRRTAGFDR
jgi:hypothetical protein